MKLSFLLIIALLMGIFTACTGKEKIENHDHAIVITKWSEKMELFMEFPQPRVDVEGKYIIHLTFLETNQPVRKGKVTLSFRQKNGDSLKVEEKEIFREGIFTPLVSFLKSGTYLFTLNYEDLNIRESFQLGEVVVYDSDEAIPLEEETADQSISFLKEQQWKTKFNTQMVKRIFLKSSIAVVGEVLPHQHGYAEVVAPVEGIVSVEHNHEMVIPGRQVKKGMVLLTICPPVSGDNSWTKLQLSYEQARSEFERAKRLKEKEAISEREYEELKRVYLIHKSGFEALLDLTPAEESETADKYDVHLDLKSKINGRVALISVKPGQSVSVGQNLMTIIDPSIVWIQMNIYEKDYFLIGEPQGAEVSIPGLDKTIVLTKDNWQILSRGEIVDRQNRTVPMIVEIKNPDLIFKVGQILHLNLYTSEEREVLAVPLSAIFDEDVQKAVFVQTEGESFEKRIVKTGMRSDGWIEIISGLSVADRVVTEGGYMVKLASQNKNIGHPHVH